MRNLLALIAATSTLAAADLNVKRVVLFKHGVGYFERQGELGPGESARLDFKANEMDDVLKSLTVNATGGSISGLRYDSSIPLAQKLEDFPVRPGERQPLSALLDQLKGARVELKFGAETVAGAIVSARAVSGKDGEREQVTLLTDSAEIRTLDLTAASAIRFPDPKLQLQFKDYLNTLLQGRSKDRRSVYIDSTDSGRRNVLASYMAPMPMWKSSYRLIFPAEGQATLEGWAIVDNTSEEDWNGIRLSLVSGKPISFISRLYEPRYIRRQVADLAEEGAVAPQVHGGVIGGIVGPRQMAAAPPPPPPMAKSRADRPMSEALGEQEFRREAVSNIAVQTEPREAGELFEYAFSQPVTVRKGQSAMLPFLQQKINARKLLIYTDSGSEFPRNAAEISNNTGKTLDGGPLTVFDGNTYAGEALMDTTKANDKRLISYAVDLGTRITTAYDSSSAIVREVKASRGVLTARSAVRETKTFTIKNVDAKAKTLIIEHPIRPGYKLIGQTAGEKTATAYRFSVNVPAAGETKFVIEEENLLDQTYSITSLNPEFLGQFLQNREISAAARTQLQAILAKKNEVATVNRDLQTTQRNIESVFKDQQRIRENLSALNRVSGQQEQVQRYSKQLADQEAQLTALRDRQAELEKRKVQLESEIQPLIEKMDF